MSAAPILPRIWASNRARPAIAPTYAEPFETLAFYRKRTEALLHRYMRASMHIGRSPSMLGDSITRGKASSSRRHGFDDNINFVIDVERCLARLDGFSRQLVARIALQEYTQGETVSLTGLSLRSVIRKYGEAIDKLTGILLECELFE
ncbi:hypothetical protein ACPOL_4321 [Acidisarcina polymorpha]|uniref:Uncharacterized protein n=1 Tax=Acidisarcina polymorpha TaxID=2211140 RepID=A0A2Z5G4Y9_9BACT|nr:hypothetical protein [Acidisarcina polymorpha]AXC13596.1 hypothetical protein ACPOL_4321 [Acidisarcina polymorpha]